MDTVLQTVTTTQLESTSTTAPSSSPITVVADEAEDQTLAAAAGTSNPELSGLTVAERLRMSLALVWQELASRASEQAFLDLLAEVYGGTSSDPAAFSLAAGALASRLAAGDTLGLRYEIETASELAGATAAYAALGDDGVATIYVNGEWLQSASDGQLRLVLLEEIGHAFDTELNGNDDSAGDEGELFAAIFAGKTLTEDQLTAIHGENDQLNLSIDGREVIAEAASQSISVILNGLISPWGSSIPIFGQTFAAPTATNWRLDNFTFYLQNLSPGTVAYTPYLYEFDASTVRRAATPLWTGQVSSYTYTTPGAIEPITWDLPDPIISQGKQYVFYLLWNSGVGDWRLGWNSTNTSYANGDFVYGYNQSDSLNRFPGDLAFNANFINDAPVLTLLSTTAFIEDNPTNAIGAVVATYATSDPENNSIAVLLSDSTNYALGTGADAGKVFLTATGLALVNAGSDLPAFTLTASDGISSGAAVSVDPSVTPVNDAPSLILSTVASINENGIAILSGTIVDPDSSVFILNLNWGDGTGQDPINLGSLGFTIAINGGGISWNPATRQFSVQHQYLDDDADDTYTISATVSDGNGGVGNATQTVTVSNVAPVVNPLSLSATTINENGSVMVTGSYTDVGTLDTHTVMIDWGNGDAATAATVDAMNKTFTATYTYLDDGITPGNSTPSDSYTITATVTDDDTLSGTASATLTVNNVAPTLSNVLVTSAIDENGIATLSGTITDPGTLDAHTLTVDWGEGGEGETYVLAAGATTFSVTHQYLEDNPTATASDVYTITGTLTDDDGGSVALGSSPLPVTVSNVAPVVNPLSLSATTINENGSVTVTGSYTDVGTLDTHTVMIDWGNGAAATAATVDAANKTFSATYTYLDDGPTPGNSTPSDSYTIKATVTDDDTLSGTASATLTVNNVAPTLSNVLVTSAINENGIATLSGTITDPGTLDGHTLTVDWGEGAPQTYNLLAGATTFSVTHQYLDDNPTGTASDVYTITGTLTDDDGGSVALGSSPLPVTVSNVAPVAANQEVFTDENNPTGTFNVLNGLTDQGIQDTHTAAEASGTTANGGIYTIAANGNAIYDPNGKFEYLAQGQLATDSFTYTAADDDGGTDSATVTVTITGTKSLQKNPLTSQFSTAMS